ncbi:restriction endonuclease subunit S [Lactobacillus delbrueckii subsp. bulgaricus]|nr:restriction endonuclease subunit S [Lactobacillus delbrueckii subsp. bulgaricus]
MKDEKKAPKLRFKGFTDDWEQCKLGDVFAERSEKSQDGNEELLSVTLKDGVIKSESLDRKNTASLDKRNYKLVIPNDIAYNSMRMWQGALGVSKFSGIVSPAYTVIKLRNQLENPYFYQYYFKKNEMLNVFRKNSQGLTSDTWNLKYPLFSRIRFFTASTREQQQISSLLYLLDQTITLHEEKKHQLERLKSALLQKMFADENGYPAVRFRGFDEAWKQCKLGDVGQTYTGLSGKSKEDFGHGKARFVTYMNIYSNPVSDLNMVEPIEIDERQNEVQYGDAFFTTSSETPEEVGMASVWTGDEKHTYLNSFCFGYRPISKINPYYLAYMLNSQSLRRKIVILAQGISRYNISKKSVMEIPASLPSAEEQNRIGLIFKDLDQSITLYEHKLELLKRLKSSLLQNMFI